MAVTKIHAIKSTLSKSLDYIMDEGKTDGKFLISSFGVTPETAHLEYKMTHELSENVRGKQKKENNNLAHHLIQSFEPDETTPEQAHELGKKLADEVLKGNYEYVITTHVDKGHIHNHVIFNAVSFLNYKKFHSDRKSYWDIRKKSDSLCKEYGLSVINSPKKKGKTYKEWLEINKGTSWKEILQINIDKNIKLAKNFESFITLMISDGYEFKDGKHIAFRAKGQERFTRSKILGDNYARDQIEKRIKNVAINRAFVKVSDNLYRGQIENISKMRMGLESTLLVRHYLADRQRRRRYAFTKSRKSVLIQKISQQLFYLRDNNITNGAELRESIKTLSSSVIQNRVNLKSEEQGLSQLQEQARLIFTYKKYEDIYNRYQKSTFKKSFEEQHYAELKLFENAKDKLEYLGLNNTGDFDKLIDFLKRKQKYVGELRDLYKKDEHKLEILNSIYDDINNNSMFIKNKYHKKSKNIDL